MSYLQATVTKQNVSHVYFVMKSDSHFLKVIQNSKYKNNINRANVSIDEIIFPNYTNLDSFNLYNVISDIFLAQRRMNEQ